MHQCSCTCWMPAHMPCPANPGPFPRPPACTSQIATKYLPSSVGGYTATGTAHSVASGRISYAFGLSGPAMTADTGGARQEWVCGCLTSSALPVAASADSCPGRLVTTAALLSSWLLICHMCSTRLCPAACSSSLVSLHMAFKALLLGNTSRAANCGANLMLSGGRCGNTTAAAAQAASAGSCWGRQEGIRSTASVC